jgi:hypothetical protein
MLPEQHRTELFQAGRWVVEGADDGFAFGDREGGQRYPPCYPKGRNIALSRAF